MSVHSGDSTRSRISEILSSFSLRRVLSRRKGSKASKKSTPSSIDVEEEPRPSISEQHHKRTTSYVSYAVHQQQKMVPAILRDPEATRKLLDAIAETPGGKRSLSRLARTCKAVSEPTLNVLWRDMHSLVPLIGLFPAHLLKKARKPSLGLVKTPSTGDWKRVLEYGERVRSITYHESANNVPPSIFTVFEEHKPQEFILPNLLRLVWRAETPDGLDRSSLFLSPELQSLDLEVGTRFPQLHLFLAEMSRRTRLTEFSFNSPTNLPDSFTELLAKQTDLQKVTLVAPGALAPGIGKWVAGLPKLRALELDLTGRSVIAVEGFFDDIRSSRSGSSTPSSDSGVFSGDEIDFSDIRKSSLRLTGDLSVARGAFRGLQGLHLTGEAGNIATFLKHLTSPLTSLELVIEDPPDKADWTDLSTMISDKFGETLRSLRLTATGSSRFSELVRSTSRLETPPKHLPLTKLAGMYRLGRLEIDLPESFIFHNADLKHLARECPNIEVLKLCPLARFTSAPFITLEGLAPLTSSCRRLHTLGIVVNADGGREEVLADRRVISRSLLRLHVGHSWISSPLQVAILLSHLAPSLETLKWFHEKNRPGFIEARAQAWQAVSDILPHLQSVRLLERRAAVEAILAAAAAAAASRSAGPAYVAPETVDKEVDATVVTSSQAVSATPLISEHSVQCSPEFVSEMIDATPLIFSVSIDATPDVADASSSASPTISEKEIDATPLTVSTEVGAVASTKSKSTETLLLSPVHGPRVEGTKWTSYMVIPSFFALILLACRVFVLYPFYIPLRIIDASLSSLHARREEPSSATKVEKRTSYSDAASLSSSDASDIPADSYELKRTITDIDKIERKSGPKTKKTVTFDVEEQKDSVELDEDGLKGRDGHRETEWLRLIAQSGRGHASEVAATRQWSSPSNTQSFSSFAAIHPSYSFIMADPKKQERDFTPEVDAILLETTSIAQSGKLQDALDKLFALEKQTRNASDLASTTRLCKAVAERSYEARDYAVLNSSILVLSKKHGQLKGAVQAIVELTMGWLEEVKARDGLERWLELVETLRIVTEGKIFLETPRARVTLLLAHYHESLAATKTTPPPKESLQTASDLLNDLQVETYSSMERREKTEFILEQMRLLIAVARVKDAEIGNDGKDSLGGGEAEWVKVRVGSRKVNEEFLKEKENEDLKLKYYDLTIQHALHNSSYLDVAKYYQKVWETPSIKEDEQDKGKAALEHIVYYIVLSPHNNEQSDMLHHIFADPALAKLDVQYNLVKCFVTRELMRWPGIEAIYGSALRTTPVFSSDKRWEDLHTRVIEHNVRVVAQYYTRITLTRLTALLDLTVQQTEETLARLVVAGTIWARIDRPSGIVNFRNKRSAEDVMNDWSSDMQKLLGLVEKTWMGVNAAQAASQRVKA